jgi:hypothetical protein
LSPFTYLFTQEQKEATAAAPEAKAPPASEVKVEAIAEKKPETAAEAKPEPKADVKPKADKGEENPAVEQVPLICQMRPSVGSFRLADHEERKPARAQERRRRKSETRRR